MVQHEIGSIWVFGGVGFGKVGFGKVEHIRVAVTGSGLMAYLTGYYLI